MKTTDLEKRLLHAIATHEYTPMNGDQPETVRDCHTWYWISDFANTMNIKVNSCRGVMGSLVKKGLVGYAKVSAKARKLGDEDTVWFTDLGFKIYRDEC